MEDLISVLALTGTQSVLDNEWINQEIITQSIEKEKEKQGQQAPVSRGLRAS